MSDGRFTGWDGTGLAYRELGRGRPLVLLHGFTGSSAQWLDSGPAAAIAERGHRVILPDFRGHGASDRPHDPAAYPPDVLADDGLALVEQLGLDDYDLGGCSLGGRIVLRMLARGARPQRAIVAGQSLNAVTSPANQDNRRKHLLSAMAAGRTLEPGSLEEVQAHWISCLGGDPVALGHVLDTHVATPLAALSGITIPVLVAVGTTDHGQVSAAALADALPGARFARVPGDHFTALGSPEFATAVLDFLGSAVSSRPPRDTAGR